MKNTIPPPQSYLGRRLFSADKQKASCLLKPLLYLISAGLLSFSSLIYAVEQGEYQHYVGFGISGAALFSDSLQEIRASGGATAPEEEGGFILVWDRFNSDNRKALSLMFLSINEEENTREEDSRGFNYFDRSSSFTGPLVLGKYFTESGFYVGGGGAFLSMNREYSRETSTSPRIETPRTEIRETGKETADSFFAPTLVLGYRGLVSEFANSHLYISVNYVKTLPVDVDIDYTTMTLEREYFSSYSSLRRVDHFEGTGTYSDLTITMIAVSFGWAW